MFLHHTIVADTTIYTADSHDRFKTPIGVINDWGEPIVICTGPNPHAFHNEAYLGKPIRPGNGDEVCPQPDRSCVGCPASKEGPPTKIT